MCIGFLQQEGKPRLGDAQSSVWSSVDKSSRDEEFFNALVGPRSIANALIANAGDDKVQYVFPFLTRVSIEEQQVDFGRDEEGRRYAKRIVVSATGESESERSFKVGHELDLLRLFLGWGGDLNNMKTSQDGERLILLPIPMLDRQVAAMAARVI